MPTLAARAPRSPLAIPVILQQSGQHVTGMTANISRSGALITNASGRPPVAAEGQLRFLALDRSLTLAAPDRLELPARIVRHASEGFAVTFLDCQASVGELLDRALARPTSNS